MKTLIRNRFVLDEVRFDEVVKQFKKLDQPGLKQMIVKAIGLGAGHWFECPNGHPYVVGECGGAI